MAQIQRKNQPRNQPTMTTEQGPHQCCQCKCACAGIHRALGRLVFKDLVYQYQPFVDSDVEAGTVFKVDKCPTNNSEHVVRNLHVAWPRIWGVIRLVQTVCSFMMMIIFARHKDIARWSSANVEIFWSVWCAFSFLYTFLLAHSYLRRSRFLVTLAPVMFAVDLETIIIYISIFIAWPGIVANSQCHGWYGNCGKFISVGWIPIASINFVLYLITAIAAWILTVEKYRPGAHSPSLRGFYQTWKDRRARKRRAYDLARRILDGTLEVVPITAAANTSTIELHNAITMPGNENANQQLQQLGFIPSGTKSVGLREARPMAQGPFSSDSSGQAEVHASSSRTPSSASSKFVLVSTEDIGANAQPCCRRCGDPEGAQPPLYFDSVAEGFIRLPVPTQTVPIPHEDYGDDAGDATERSELLSNYM